MNELFLLISLSYVIPTSSVILFNDVNKFVNLKHETCNFSISPFSLTLFTFYKSNMCLPSEDSVCDISWSKSRFLLYDVNPGEGFNLRRDVFLRVATLVHKLSKDQSWVLVLPPWGNLYHWKNEKRWKFYNWREFFNLDSIAKFISVIDLEHYVKGYGPFIDTSFVMQQYAEGWGEKYEEKYEVRHCLEENNFRQISNKISLWKFSKWSTNFLASNFECLSFQGQSSTIIPLLQNITNDFDKSSVILDRAETLLHDEFGGVNYWAARRSMKFSDALLEEASLFRSMHLSSNDSNDNIEQRKDWIDYKPKRTKPNSKGGPYLAVHLRRRDFLYARKTEVPDIKSAANQLQKLLKSRLLNTLFVATDAPSYEVEELRRLMVGFKVHTFIPTESFISKFGDGGVAIVDQIICSYARYFVGTYESTFSFRIQEEREIMGFAVEDTFNRLCGSNPKCEKPTKWTIVY